MPSEASRERGRRMRDVVMRIPLGCVASYGQVAALAGYPRHSRFVGRALGEADDRVALPWHRVINSSGRIAFARDSDSFIEQSQRLAQEGVTVIAGKIDMAKFGWRPDLDAMLWGPDSGSFTE